MSDRNSACPTCGRSAPWQQHDPWRPFCSERCKLIDLGAWASESYRIAGPLVSEDGLDSHGNDNQA